MDPDWTHQFDAVLEKGALDAVPFISLEMETSWNEGTVK
jgi:hypothetical protein